MMWGRGFRRSSRHGESAPDRLLDILNRRYAQGEINKQAFEEKKKEIAVRT